MISMLAHALKYLGLGYSIIPQRPGGKKPLIRWKPFQESLPTQENVIEWWTRWPNAGMNLILGPVSGVVAVDVDSFDAHQVLCDLLDGEPKTLKSLSGSRKPGKAHYIYRCPSFETTARYTPLHPQLEFRGHRGYIVLPPSLHPTGNRYEWARPMCEISELPSPLAKAWQANPRFRSKTVKQDAGRQHQDFGVSPRTLMSILRLPRLSRSTQQWLIGDFAYDSGWNHRLFCAACDLAGLGVSYEVAEPLLLRGAMPRTAADEDSARRTIHSAFCNERVPFCDFEVAEPNPSNCMNEDDTAKDEIRIIVPTRLRRTLRVEVR